MSVMVALCVLMLVLPIAWVWEMSNRQDKEKAVSRIIHNSYNKVKGKYQRNFHQQRMQELANANIPLLEPYRAEMQKNDKDVSHFVAEYSENANEYNKIIKCDELRLTKYYAVMFLITSFIIISLLIHYINTHSL
jgi:preprotein translocase subunit SecG